MSKRVAAQQARAAVANQSRGMMYGTASTGNASHQQPMTTSYNNIQTTALQPVELKASGQQATTLHGIPLQERRRAPMGIDKNALNRLDEIFSDKEDIIWQILDCEKSIEEKILRKQLAIADASFRVRKVARMLQMHVSHTIHEGSEEGGVEGLFAWTLHVEGHLEDETGAYAAGSKVASLHPALKFTNLLKSAILVTQGEDTTQEKIDEWIREPGHKPTDGFEIKGTGPTKVKVILTLDPQLPLYKIAPALAELTGLKTATRSQVIMALWQYIKLQRLQESEEKKAVRLDDKLMAVFGRPNGGTITFADLPALIQPGMLPLDPIIIEYNVDESRGKVAALELPLMVEDRPLYPMASFAQTLSSTISSTASTANKQLAGPAFTPLVELTNSIAETESQMREYTGAALECKNVQRWLREYAVDPCKAHGKLAELIAADYDAMIGQMRITLGELLRGSTYQGEDMLEAIRAYLAYSSVQEGETSEALPKRARTE